MRRRILNERLAAIVASIRHGEMIFVADAGSGTCAQAPEGNVKRFTPPRSQRCPST